MADTAHQTSNTPQAVCAKAAKKRETQKLVGDAVGLLAGFDTLYWSSQARISAAIRAQLEEAKAHAQVAAKVGSVHCPEWLGARVLPTGARGYSFVLETEDFTVKVAGEHMLTWPGLYCELRSHFLHTHPHGQRGAVEASLCWVRTQVLADRDERDVRARCSFETVTPSRFDLHFDWQGGFAPTFHAGEAGRFIKPRRVKWHPYFEGTRCTGYRFGEGGHIVARLYNKTLQCRDRHDEGYAALLAARCGAAFDPDRDVWRLEFQVRREGMTSFRLAQTSDVAADGSQPEAVEAALEAEIAAELSAEELPHLGTFPKLFAHREAIWRHLTTHWLRLVRPPRRGQGQGKVRSRWPLDPTWRLLQGGFGRLADAPPLDAAGRELARAFRYAGRQRLLRRMALGVVKALEVADASVASASLATVEGLLVDERALRRFLGPVARVEALRLEQRKRAVTLASGGIVPPWVEHGMGTAGDQPERVRHLLQMLLGIFAAYGVLPLDREHLKPAHSVGDLLVQHLDTLDAEAEERGGIGHVLAAHFAKVYKVAAPRELVGAVPLPTE